MSENKFKKYLKAFTIAELVMSLFVSAIIGVTALNIVFKKDKAPKRNTAHKRGGWICGYSAWINKGYTYESHKQKILDSIGEDWENTASATGCYSPLHEWEHYLHLSKEFVMLRLIGAGARGNSEYCAGAGQETIIIIPSLSLPFEQGDALKCETPTCKECGDDKVCTKCVRGYKLVNGVCEVNFTYRSIIGVTPPTAPNNGSATLFAATELDEGVAGNGKYGYTKILGMAMGGTIEKKIGDTCPEDVSSGAFGAGSPINEGDNDDKLGMGEVRQVW